jgi:hypothetical protein
MQEMKRVLFLDVDGVLNNRHTTDRWQGFIGIDDDKAKLLDRIVIETGCYIVLSSTWRKQIDNVNYLFSRLNPGTRCMIIGKTPVLHNATRGDEIQEWLDCNPGVERFVIVDDDEDMGELTSHLVRTAWEVGMTTDIANEIIVKLNAVDVDEDE